MAHDIEQLPEWSRDWARARLEQHVRLGHRVDHEAWVGLRDWLASLPTQRPRMVGKLHKLSMAGALVAQSVWHAEMAARAQRIARQRGSFGGDPDAVEVVMSTTLDPATGVESAQQGVEQGWHWVRVTTPLGLDYEGAAMGHCVGGGNYDEGCTIYSLRDPDNMPHCTIEWNPDERSVNQVQGRANGPVVTRYHRAVVAFINSLEPQNVEGAGNFGHVFGQGKLLHWSDIPADFVVEGDLDLNHIEGLQKLPAGLQVTGDLLAYKCRDLVEIGHGVRVGGNLLLAGCTALESLPPDLEVGARLYMSECTALVGFPGTIRVGESIILYNCTSLRSFPPGIKLNDTLDLEGCTALTHLPDDLEVDRLDIQRCTGLVDLPAYLEVTSLLAVNCTGLVDLPVGLKVKKRLDLRGCTGLRCLPDDLEVGGYIYLGGCTGLQTIPPGLDQDDHTLKLPAKPSGSADQIRDDIRDDMELPIYTGIYTGI